MAGHEINLWVRADLQTYNPETLALIPEALHERYQQVMHELGAAGVALSDAQVRFSEARDNRQQFFEGLAYEG
jgi:hypothetical protein